MEICYRITELLIEDIFRNDLIEIDSKWKFHPILMVQQIRTIDQNAQLEVTFPSRIDLECLHKNDVRCFVFSLCSFISKCDTSLYMNKKTQGEYEDEISERSRKVHKKKYDDIEKERRCESMMIHL